jgi:hypothetical protein
MSRWLSVTVGLSVGILVFAGSGEGYNGGPLRNVTVTSQYPRVELAEVLAASLLGGRAGQPQS